MYDQKRSVREVKSFLWFECGQSALLERLKVGDADTYFIILPMHFMQSNWQYLPKIVAVLLPLQYGY